MRPCCELCRTVREVDEAAGAGAHGRLGELGHLGHVVHGGIVMGALAHHVGAQRGVRNLGGDVDRARRGVECVEVLGEGLPLPVDALVERGAGDVLDTLHQLDEEVLAIGAHGGEAHTAVPHHDGGHAVPARRGHVGIPRGLAVVVGVDVDPPRHQDEAVAVDLSTPALGDVAHFGDELAVDGDIGRTSRPPGAVDDRGPPNNEIVHNGQPTARRICQGPVGDCRQRGWGPRCIRGGRSSRQRLSRPSRRGRRREGRRGPSG